MFRRYKHKWKIVSQNYTISQISKISNVTGPNAVTYLRELSFGITATGLQCSICGDFKARTDIGDVRVANGT
jgi:hypothetical protein